MTDPWFDAVQDAHWGPADERHFAWTTLDPGFAPVEDELLAGPLATLEHPCLEIGCGDGTNLARLIEQNPEMTARIIERSQTRARKIADNVAMIYQGKIVWSGATEAIDDSGNGIVDQFVHGRTGGPIRMPARAP